MCPGFICFRIYYFCSFSTNESLLLITNFPFHRRNSCLISIFFLGLYLWKSNKTAMLVFERRR